MRLDWKVLREMLPWLEEEKSSFYVLQGKGYSAGFAFIRVPAGKTVDAVFGAGFFPCGGEKPFVSSEKLDQIGFFHKPTSVFYPLCRISEMPDGYARMDDVEASLRDAVKHEATERIRKNADFFRSSASPEDRRFVEEQENRVAQMACSRFLGDEWRWKVNFPTPIISKANTVDYLDAPQETLTSLVEKYLEKNRESIACDLLLEDAVSEAYEKLIANPLQWAVAHRDIVRAVKKSGAVNVRLTIENERGQTMTFPYPASSLINTPVDNGCFAYTGWVLTCQQRFELEDFFRSDESRPYCGTGFRPEEVKEITYKKKVLYQR